MKPIDYSVTYSVDDRMESTVVRMATAIGKYSIARRTGAPKDKKWAKDKAVTAINAFAYYAGLTKFDMAAAFHAYLEEEKHISEMVADG